MARLREIRGRIRAVGNIQRITRTMQMIATARFQAAQKRAVSAQPYTRKIAELVGELASSLSGDASITHPLLRGPEPKVNRKLVLVLTTNRGLCGGYNANILRTATAFLRHSGNAPAPGSVPGSAAEGISGGIDVELVGRKGAAYFRFNKLPVAQFHSQFTDKSAYDEVEKLAVRYMQLFTEGKYDSVHVVHMAFQSVSRQSPRVLDLLPLRNPAEIAGQLAKGIKGKAAGTSGSGSATGSSGGVQYDFSPEPKTLLAELLPVTVKSQLYQCFNEAIVSEHIARMVAMKSATDAAGKMRKNLNRQYNRARQAAITKELLEVVAGAEGLG